LKRFRKWLIVTHRWAGVALSLLFVIWFASGIAMIYARDMPSLTPETRLDRLPPIPFDRVRLSVARAIDEALYDPPPQGPTLTTVMDRPAYRFPGRSPATIFADNGEYLEEVGPERAKTIASRFVNLPEERLRAAGVLTEADQWTISQRGRLPLHKFIVEDDAGTELYVSAQVAEVTLMTTRRSRMLAWVAAIPHWFYFAPLRLNDALWRSVVVWTSVAGCLLALAGIVLGVIQLRISRPFSLARVGSYIPYAGWMRWHFITGLIFGVFTLTWVFSGLLSMDPLNWAASASRVADDVDARLTEGPPDLAQFPQMDAGKWQQVASGAPIKEVQFTWLQGNPYYVVRRTGSVPGARARWPDRMLVDARTLQVRHEPFSLESVMQRVHPSVGDVPILDAQVLTAYDAYYYSRGYSSSAPPLPVVRIKLGDAERTWLYVDLVESRVAYSVHRLARLERWIYNGFHSLDFAFWYGRRPLWDIGVILLSLGGLTTSTIGLYLGWKRVFGIVRRVPGQ
jgi:hypothetical protein